MPMTILQPCCQRKQAAVTRAKADVALFARRAAQQSSPSAKALANIAEAKETLRLALQFQAEHEATHASE